MRSLLALMLVIGIIIGMYCQYDEQVVFIDVQEYDERQYDPLDQGPRYRSLPPFLGEQT
jgi:hypothetical protein